MPGEGEVVGYALEAVRSTYETVDWGNPGIMNDMPQMLLDYGAHQAALGRMKFPGDDVLF